MAYDFDTIAHGYDRMNHLMTLGLDRRWRKRAVSAVNAVESGERRAESVLDVACGTGDMSTALMKRGSRVTGVDISEEMLAVARKKTASANPRFPVPAFQIADAEALPFGDGTFDAVTCAFGVRNFVHLEQGLGEMLRVLKPGGRMAILELATPDSAIVKPFYRLYTRRIIPWLGALVAGNREAYTYLPQSIERFPKGQSFMDIVCRLGASARQRRLTLGVCRLYTVEKQRGRQC